MTHVSGPQVQSELRDFQFSGALLHIVETDMFIKVITSLSELSLGEVIGPVIVY